MPDLDFNISVEQEFQLAVMCAQLEHLPLDACQEMIRVLLKQDMIRKNLIQQLLAKGL
jgi:hypothetical protein